MKSKILILVLLFLCAFMSVKGTDSNNVPAASLVKVCCLGNTRVVVDTLKEEFEAASDSLLNELKTRSKQAFNDSIKSNVNIPEISEDSAAIGEAGAVIKHEIQENVNDIDGIGIPDSLSGQQVSNEAKALSKSALEHELGEEIPETTIDSTTIETAKEELVKKGEQHLKNRPEYQEIQNSNNGSELDQLGEYKGELDQAQKALARDGQKEELKHKATSLAQEHFAAHADKLGKAQSEIDNFKLKYDSLLSTRQLNDTAKSNSLKDKSFFRRIIIGGNFTISGTGPINLNFSPTVGYRFNKLFEMGLRSIYRAELPAEQCLSKAQEYGEVRGYSIFASHKAFRGVFIHLELERMETVVQKPSNLQPGWHEILLIGIGRNWSATKWLDVQTLLLYNMIHKNDHGLYNSPVVFKSGFRFR